MPSSRPSLSPEVKVLLDRERVVPAVPSHVRARVLARARAALISGRIDALTEPRGGPPARWRVTAVLACAASVAVAATAYEIGTHGRPAPTALPGTPSAHTLVPIATPLIHATPPVSPAVTNGAPPMSRAPTGMNPSRTVRNDSGPEELHLLRLARAAVARRDFAAALRPIAEHARRFEAGRLTEEREALRVMALSGLGRGKEARHAANAFEARFPRSVLLPAVSHVAAGKP